MTSSSTAAPRPSDAWFMTTHWTMVLSARSGASPQSAAALEELCRVYWYPLYAYVRRQGRTPEDAEDLTQGFFARLLEKDYLRAVGREKGRFRTFLLVALKRFLANEWDRARAQKRGGGQALLSLDFATGETRFLAEPAQALSPDKIYERRWALTLLDQAMDQLRGEYDKTGKLAEFNRLKTCLTTERGALKYAELAADLGMSEGAARVAVHRLRRRFREVFHAVIAQTVSSPNEIAAETRHLLTVLGEG